MYSLKKNLIIIHCQDQCYVSDGGSEFLPMTQAKVFAENKRRGRLVRGVWKDLRIIEEIHIYYLRTENPALIFEDTPFFIHNMCQSCCPDFRSLPLQLTRLRGAEREEGESKK